MRARIDKGSAWACLLIGVAAVFGTLVWGTFGRDHTKVVTKTNTVTRTVTKKVKVAGQWDGNIQTLANYLHPSHAAQIKCPKGAPANIKCYVFDDSKFYVTAAVLAQ